MNADVVVVGGSLVGCAVAGFLAREGVSVVLVERNAHLEDTAQGMGFVELGVLEHPHRTRAAVGEQAFGELLAFWRRNREIAKEEGLFHATGVSWHAIDAREPDSFAASQEALAACDEHSLREEKPGFHGVWNLPAWGRIDPRRALQHFTKGVEVVLDTEARIESWDPLRVAGMNPEIVVLTAGFGCAALEGRLEACLTPVREAGLIIDEPIAPITARSGQGYTAWRDDGVGVRVAGARWATPHMEVAERSVAIEPRIQAKLEAFARQKLGLTGAVAKRYAHITAHTKDQLPLIGPLPGQARVMLATGFGAMSASWSFAAARAIADGILTGHANVPTCCTTSRLVRWR